MCVRAPVEAAPLSAGAERPPTLSKCKSKADKENTRVPGGGKGDEAYEPFARMEKRKEKMRPQWNTQRYKEEYLMPAIFTKRFQSCHYYKNIIDIKTDYLNQR